MSLPDAMLESRLDLSVAQVLEPEPGQLVVASTRTTAQVALAGMCGAACLVCAFFVWRQWREAWLAALYPFGLIALVFGFMFLVVLFGRQTKRFHAASRTAEVQASLGPVRDRRFYALPEKGQVRLTLRREQPSHASRTAAIATRWYDIDVADLKALGFTVAGDRAVARAFAGRLATLLGYEVLDEVEDDGVTRLKP